MKNDSNNSNVTGRYYGLIIVKSENSNYNADFTGNARRLPNEDGTIYATDKVLKYSIRRYWVDKGKDVFVWRSHSPNGNVRTRNERMEFMKSKLASNKDIKDNIEIGQWLELLQGKTKIEDWHNSVGEGDQGLVSKKKEIIDLLKGNLKKGKIEKTIVDNLIKENKKVVTASIFSKCIDTKLFGVTYTGEGPLSLTGPVQITYGINKYTENINYINDILSPYPTGDEGAAQSSIGKEKKVLESYYVYDFSINPKNIISHYNSSEDIKSMMNITQSDIDDLKEAFKYSVTALDTSSKIGSENVMLLFIPMNDDKNYLPTMKQLVVVSKDDGQIEVNLSKVNKLLEEKDTVGSVELHYNDNIVKVSGENKNWAIDKNL